MCRRECGMGHTDFDPYIFPGDLKRIKFWFWAGKKSSRAEKWNSQVSRTHLCLWRRLPKIICVYTFEKWDYVRNLRCTCQLVNTASSWTEGWKDHQGFAVATLAHLQPVLWQQSLTDTWIWVETFYSSPELLSLLLTKKYCIYFVTLNKFRPCSFIPSPCADLLQIIQEAKGSKNISPKFSWWYIK